MVFHTLFGFSQNFWMAVLTRLLLGLFNGLHGPAKARCFQAWVEGFLEFPLFISIN
jgi:sugar phosphate permease